MCFSLARIFLAAALLALPAAAEAQWDTSVKAPSATAAQRSPARAPAAKDAAKPGIEKPVSTQEQPRAARHNSTVVGLAAGRPEDSFSSYAADLATVLDDGENLRVLPMASYGAAGNIVDLLYLNNVDVAITYADVLDHFKATEKIPNIEQRLHYIIPMFQSEVHLLVRPEIKTIQDLAGKKVGLDTHGSGANHTGAIVFQRLGVQVEQIALSNAVALEAMRNNELAGIVHLASKPNELFGKDRPKSRLPPPCDRVLGQVPRPLRAGRDLERRLPRPRPEGAYHPHHLGAGRSCGVQLAVRLRPPPPLGALRGGAVQRL